MTLRRLATVGVFLNPVGPLAVESLSVACREVDSEEILSLLGYSSPTTRSIRRSGISHMSATAT